MVGGGVAGLAAAVQLASDGSTVLLVEPKDTLGGRVRMRDSSNWLLDPGLHLLRRKGPLNQLLRKLRAPRVLGPRWNHREMLAIDSDHGEALTTLATMSIGSEGAERPEFVLPRGGWSSLVGRLIVAANQLDVMFDVGSTAEALNLGSDGRLSSMRVSGKDIECDEAVLAVPPTESARLLESTGFDASDLRRCTEHRAAVLDVALEGRPMRPYSGLFDASRGIIAVDSSTEDRVPDGVNASACTILHAVNLAGDGPDALQSIKELLDSRCSGWRNMAAARRSTASIMLHPCTRGQRVDGLAFLDSRIALAGCHVISEHHLSDAATDTGRGAAKALKLSR